LFKFQHELRGHRQLSLRNAAILIFERNDRKSVAPTFCYIYQ